jgi:hypothetical protein
MAGGRCIAVVSCVVAAMALLRTPARAIQLLADVPVLGQVRDGAFGDGTEAPIEMYGNLGVSDIRHGATLDTYFRLEEDFAQWNGETDFYSGVLRVPNAVPWLDAQLGRQVVSQAPTTIFDADAGQIGLAPGGPVAFTAFGGQPRYFEPTYGAPGYSENEQIFGGTLRTTQLTNGSVSVGYLQQYRDGREIKQLVNTSGVRSFLRWPGMPNLYGSFAYDADHQNIDQVRAGTQAYVGNPRLLVNFESSYYKPQDNGRVLIPDLNRREDPIFQVFSLSQELQFRGGAHYQATRTLSAFADLSYQRYEQLATPVTQSYVNGYVWGTGLLYLPGGDGLEVVNVEYYGTDGGGGSVNGARGSYENRVYDRILFRAVADVSYYDKATNQSGTSLYSVIGLGYVILPGLVGELNFEADRNQLFPEDFRFGFFITYNARYRTQPPPDDGMRRTWTADQQRPWPWGLPKFGPAAWSPLPQPWAATAAASTPPSAGGVQ